MNFVNFNVYDILYFDEDLTSSNMKLKCNFKSSQKEMASCTVIEGQLPQ